MMLKVTNRILRVCGWGVLALLVVIAVVLVAGRVVSWSVNESEERVNAYLRDRGFDFVRLGRVASSWQVYDPCFVLQDVTIRPDGVSGISIDELSIRVDSIGSLLQGSVTISEINVAGVRLTLLRDTAGFWVKGFGRGDNNLDISQVRDLLSRMTQLDASDIVVDVEDVEDGKVVLQLLSAPDAPLQVVRSGKTRQVFMPLFLRRSDEARLDTSNRITLTGTYQGIPGDRNFKADLFVEAPDLNLNGLLPQWRIGEDALSPGRLKASGWLSVEDTVLDLTGDVTWADLSLLRESGNTGLLDQMNFQFRMATAGEGIAIRIPEMTLEAPDLSWSVQSLSLAVENGASGVEVALQMPRLDVSHLTDLAGYAGTRQLVPEDALTALEALNLQGALERVSFRAGAGKGARLTASIRGLSLDAYKGVPGIDRLDGFVSFEPDKGYLDIDNEAFTLNFRNLFPEPWSFDSGRGRVYYQVADTQVIVSSGLIELLDGDLSAYGKLNLNLPPEQIRHTWGLTLGVLNAELLGAFRYVPNTIPQEVSAWVHDAVRGGWGDESGLTFHGALPKSAPGLWKSHDLYFKARDTRLRYHPDWPEVEAGTGIVEVTSYYVRSRQLTGRVYDTTITSSTVDMPFVFNSETGSSKADHILVDAQAEGPFSDGIRVLKETPLALTTGNMAEAWHGEGSVQGSLAIEVPLGERSGEPVKPDVDMHILDATLNMDDFDLSIADLKGQILYTNELGLRSPQFVGRTFNQPLSGSVTSELRGEAGQVIVSVDGRISAADLYGWSDQLLLSRASGEMDYGARIYVPYGGTRDEASVEATTSLVGVTFDLPYPLSKPDPDSALPFVYRQLFKEDSFIVDLDLDSYVKASLKVEDGIATGGRIHFGEEVFGAVTYDGIRMTGHLDHLVYTDWLQVTEDLGEISDVSIEDEIKAHVESASLDVKRLTLYDLELEDVDVEVTRSPAAWEIKLDNNMLTGHASVPDADELPLVINLEQLRISSGEGAGDPLGDVNPLEIGSIDFSTEHLLLDEKDYGSWQFEFRVDENVARFNNLTGQSTGVRLQPGSQLEWELLDGTHTSRFEGEILIEDLAAALTQFGFASSIEGEGLKMTTSMSWPGSPAMVDVETVNGEVSIHEGKGRFVQAEAGGALKLLGIFDFASLARRFRFDFSDVLDEGLEFSDISGTTDFNQGEVNVRERIVIDGSGGKFTVGGSVDLKSRSLDNDMIVTLPLNRTLPWYAAYSAIATGPLAGAGVMLAKLMFENQIDQMSSARYKISGTLDQPNIEFVAIFDDDVRESEAPETPVQPELTPPVPEQVSPEVEVSREAEVSRTSEDGQEIGEDGG